MATTVGVLTGIAVSTVLVGWWIGPIVAVTLAASSATVWLALRKIGGLVGDVLGAIEQVVECVVLVTVSGLAARHAVWWG